MHFCDCNLLRKNSCCERKMFTKKRYYVMTTFSISVFLLLFTKFEIEETASEKRVEFIPVVEKPPEEFPKRKRLRLSTIRLPLWPWKDDPNCSKFNTSFAVRKSLKPLALASFPGSGNTWLRYLLERATGIFTGSVYYDYSLVTGDFLGEKEDWNIGTTILQKTHLSTPQRIKQFTNNVAILLIRNPYDAIVAYHNYMHAGHTNFAPSETFKTKEWENKTMESVISWVENIKNWTTYHPHVHVIHYENLKDNTANELREILKFISIPINEERIQCTLKHSKGKFKRREYDENVDPFPPEIRKTMNSAILHINKYLKLNNYPEIPLRKYRYFKMPKSTN